MNLYSLLTAARGRQILAKNNWPALGMDIPECGKQITLKGTVSAAVLIELVPHLAERGRLAKGAEKSLQALCRENDITAEVYVQIGYIEISVDVKVAGIPEPEKICQDYLTLALQDELWVMGDTFRRDAETILQQTGARYDGAHIFERETRHFIVAAEAWYDIPASMYPGEQLLQAWLTEILVYGAEVMTIGLVVWRQFGMLRVCEHRLPQVCVVRPDTPVRHWLNREHVAELMQKARKHIANEREITASFGKRKF